MHTVITDRGLLAIEVVAYLASQNGEIRRQREIGAALGEPNRYLEPVLQRLSSACLISSKRGPHGGFAFSALPDVMNAADIMAEFQPKGARRTSEVKTTLGFALNGALSNVTIAQLVPSL